MTENSNSSNEEFFENDKEKLANVIHQLEALVEKEKFLKVRSDDNFFLRYLRCSHYNPEMAFRKMKTYYKLKFQYHEWYVTKETIEDFKTEFDDHLYYVLQDRDRFGKRIYISKLGMIDTSKTTMAKQSQIQDFYLELIFDEEETQKNGISVIVDLKNFSWALLKWLTPSNVCIAVRKIESLPCKKIEFHVVNTSVAVSAAIKLIWPFLSAKTRENIHFHHEDWPSLHKIIDPECLPNQYGGSKLNVNIKKPLKIIPSYTEKLKENLRLGYSQKPEN